jgi:CheY-like chemotaxis protein
MKNDLRILLLEDVPAEAELINAELRNDGISFQAERVDTREEFLREIETNPPDVILSDHGLPSFDGFAALALAREKCPETPFIFVTGSMGEEVAVNSLRNGATDYVLKNRLSNLAPAVRRALDLSKEKTKAPPDGSIIREDGRGDPSASLQAAECDPRSQQQVIELHLAYEIMERFASSLHSEMLAPLGHFESFLEVLRTDAERHLDEKSRPYLNAICRSLRQAGRMICDMLAFSPHGRAELHNVRINLVEVIKDMLHDMWSELESRRMVRSRFVPLEYGHDPSLLRHALYNLIAHCAPLRAVYW